MILHETANAALRSLPHDPRSGSCLGISRYDYCPCTSCHALGQRGKRYSISRPPPLGLIGFVAASPHPAIFCIVLRAWHSTSALSNSTASPGPVLKHPHKTLIAAPCAPGVICSQPPLRVSQSTRSSAETTKAAIQTRMRPLLFQSDESVLLLLGNLRLLALGLSRRLKNWALAPGVCFLD